VGSEIPGEEMGGCIEMGQVHHDYRMVRIIFLDHTVQMPQVGKIPENDLIPAQDFSTEVGALINFPSQISA
jgi:hypothetical protein